MPLWFGRSRSERSACLARCEPSKSAIFRCARASGPAEAILRGDAPSWLPTTPYEEEIVRSLKSMESEEQNPAIDPEVTFEEYQQLFSITRESTASSPSGIHMGHYKVGALFPEIGIVLAKMMSYPFMYGFSP